MPALSIPRAANGFRSALRDWAAERTDLPREVAEAALAHIVSNQLEAAYRRGDLVEKRPKTHGRVERLLRALTDDRAHELVSRFVRIRDIRDAGQ